MKRLAISGPSAAALATLALGALPAGAATQTRPYAPEAVTASEYARAEQFLFWNAEKLTSGATVAPRWVDANRFWYRNQVFGGHAFILVDAASRIARARLQPRPPRRRPLRGLRREPRGDGPPLR